MLPGIDGAEVCRRIRATRRPFPIILLTALGSTDDRIAGLEAGADDYLTKPFSPRELVLRVQSILRRSVGELTPEAPFELGPFELDPVGPHHHARTASALALSVREFDLFSFLLKHPRQAFNREQLLRAVWHWEFGDLSTVTVTVRRVREKIEADPTTPAHAGDGVGRRLPSRPVRTIMLSLPDLATVVGIALACALVVGARRPRAAARSPAARR